MNDKTISAKKIATRAGFGFAVACVALLGAQQLSAQAIAGFNSRQPVDYAADRIELQDRAEQVVLSGNVVVNQGDLRLTADRTIVNYTNTDALRIQRITATGGVSVQRGSENARGNVGVYDFNRRTITLVGNVALRRGTDTLNGGRLVIDLNTGVSSVDGSSAGSSSATGVTGNSGGRVSGRFSVPEN